MGTDKPQSSGSKSRRRNHVKAKKSNRSKADAAALEKAAADLAGATEKKQDWTDAKDKPPIERVVTIEKIVYVPMPARMAYEHAVMVYRRYREQIKRLDPTRITSLSCGDRYQNGEPTGEFSIRIHVRTKQDKYELRAKALAGHIDLRPFYEGVPIDIVVTDFEIAAGPSTPDDGRKVYGEGGQGTIGTVAFGPDGAFAWVTAGHVMSKSIPLAKDQGAKDSDNVTVIGTTPQDGVHYSRDNFVDCAVIVPKNPLPRPTVSRRQRDPNADDIALHRPVEIWGASTPYKSGVIDSLEHEPIPLPKSGETAEEHFLIRSSTGQFAQDGDSGAIVMIGNNAIGMVRAVTKNPDGVLLTVAVRMSRLCAALAVDFYVT